MAHREGRPWEVERRCKGRWAGEGRVDVGGGTYGGSSGGGKRKSREDVLCGGVVGQDKTDRE